MGQIHVVFTLNMKKKIRVWKGYVHDKQNLLEKNQYLEIITLLKKPPKMFGGKWKFCISTNGDMLATATEHVPSPHTVETAALMSCSEMLVPTSCCGLDISYRNGCFQSLVLDPQELLLNQSEAVRKAGYRTSPNSHEPQSWAYGIQLLE